MLATLPTEVIIRILGYADPQSRIRCRSVNHRLKYIVDDSDELQLQTECEIAGLICATPRPGNHTVQTQLQAVRAYQKAWRTMNWTQSVRYPSFGTWVDGYTSGMSWSPHFEHFVPNIMTHITSSSLDICRIPSPTREIAGRKWRLDGLSFCVEAYVIDPGQDLLVALEQVPQLASAQTINVQHTRGVYDYRIHFLSLATGEPHRLSVSPVLLSPNSSWGDETMEPGVELSIGYRYIGILLHLDLYTTANELWVVQWDTAAIKVHAFQSPSPLQNDGPDDPRIWHRATSLRFLDSTSLILSFISCRSGNPAELGLIRILEDIQDGQLYELVCVTFELPRPNLLYQYGTVGTTTPWHRPVLPLDSRRSDDCGLFYPAEKSRVLYYHLDMTRETSYRKSVSFHLIVAPMVLHHLYELYLRNAGDLSGKYDDGIKVRGHTLIIPWKAWEKETRLLHEPAAMHGRLSTSHNRLMISKIERVPRAEPVVIVMGGIYNVPPRHEYRRTNVEMVLYEFSSRLALQRDMHVYSSEEANAIAVETEYHLGLETVEDGDSIWDEPVETGLPYRKSVINLVEAPDAQVRESAIFNDGIGISRGTGADSGTEWEIFSV